MSEGDAPSDRANAWRSDEFELISKPAFPKKSSDCLLPVLFHGKWRGSEESARALLRWTMTLWPGNQEAVFAYGAERLRASLGYADAYDREFATYLEPIVRPHTELRPMASLALAVGLAVKDAALRAQAQDGLIAAISDGRATDQLGVTMRLLLSSGRNPFTRWSKSLAEVARVSPLHARVAVDLVETAMQGDPRKAPRDLGQLIEVYLELLSETGSRPPEPTRKYLSGLGKGGKPGRLGVQILAL